MAKKLKTWGKPAPAEDPGDTGNVFSASENEKEETSNHDTDQQQEQDRHKNTWGTEDQMEDVGGVTATAVVCTLDGSKLTRVGESQADATRRWRNEGISEQVAAFRDRMREQYREENPGCRRRDAHDYAWERALAEFPPGKPPRDLEPAPAAEEPAAPPPPADMGVVGLGDMPPDWPPLPANASLQAEIAWVSANRLRVRDGSGVDLSRAISPAPSYSALSWLETSILFPSKFADISVKATAQQDDEREHIRREKIAIEEMRAILAEMLEG